MTFAAALSEHPMTATAVGETAGQILETLGGQPPDLVTLFVTPHHAGALEDAATAVRTVLDPGVLVGCAAISVLGNGREVEDGPGVALWAATLGVPVAPVHLNVVRTTDGLALSGWSEPAFDPGALLLLADPYSFPAEGFFEHLAGAHPGMPIVGGNASAAAAPGGNRLVIDGDVVTSGAVGALIGRDVTVEPVVSQGCRPIGNPYAVTRSEQNVVFELGGEPAYQRLADIAAGLPEEDAGLLSNGVLLGVVVDETKLDYARGDFLARNLLEIDRATGAVVVGDVVTVGTTAQYLVRDAATADEDLRAMLAGRRSAGVLAFTCNGRGARFFAEPDHDAAVVAELLDDPATAGFFAAGEFGPVGARNFVHGYTASIALFTEGHG